MAVNWESNNVPLSSVNVYLAAMDQPGDKTQTTLHQHPINLSLWRGNLNCNHNSC